MRLAKCGPFQFHEVAGWGSFLCHGFDPSQALAFVLGLISLEIAMLLILGLMGYLAVTP